MLRIGGSEHGIRRGSLIWDVEDLATKENEEFTCVSLFFSYFCGQNCFDSFRKSRVSYFRISEERVDELVVVEIRKLADDEGQVALRRRVH